MERFFGPPPPPEPQAPREPPAWAGPPRGVLGRRLPDQILLARSESVAVAIDRITAFPNGFEVVLAGVPNPELLSSGGRPLFDLLRTDPIPPPNVQTEEVPPEVFRFGMQFADGSKATSLDRRPTRESEPDGPVLLGTSRGWSVERWSAHYWCWPLPPPGSMRFVCEWPAAGIELTAVEFDGRRLRDAGAELRPLWGADGPETA